MATRLQEQDQKIAQLEKMLAQVVGTLRERDNLLSEKDSEIDQQKATIMSLQWQLSSLQRMLFASKSERTIPAENPLQLQLELGLEAAQASEVKKETISYERRVKSTKQVNVREPLPASLQRETHILEPEDIPVLLKL